MVSESFGVTPDTASNAGMVGQVACRSYEKAVEYRVLLWPSPEDTGPGLEIAIPSPALRKS